MFGIGPTEFFVIIVVAVLVLGPEHLPKVMRTFNKAMSEFRKVSTDFQRTINVEATQEDLRKNLTKQPAKKAAVTKKDVQNTPEQSSAKTNVSIEQEQGSAPTATPVDNTIEKTPEDTPAPRENQSTTA